MKLNIPQHSVLLFDAVRDSKVFYADISVLPRPATGRLYDDAMDLGFDMSHPKTGAIVRFVMVEEASLYGEVTHWSFAPSNESLTLYPKLQGWTVIIYND